MLGGDTFFLRGIEEHMWAIISDPALDAGKVVVVKFVSWQLKYDQACIVKPREHRFIKHDTCVDYPDARVVPHVRLEDLRAARKLKLDDPLNAALLYKIRLSAEGSDIPKGAYDVLRRQRFVP